MVGKQAHTRVCHAIGPSIFLGNTQGLGGVVPYSGSV